MPREGMLIRWTAATSCCLDDATGIVVNALFCEQENTRDYFRMA